MTAGRRAASAALALCVCIAHAAGAKVKLAAPFADGMVLQRDCSVPVWGTAAAGEKVRVAFAGQVRETVADKDGSWRVDLAPLATSSEGRTLTVNELSVGDVVVGEVWLCSGQSNMAMSLAIGRTRYGDGIGAMVAQTTDKPLVRYMDAAPGARGWNRLTPSFLSSRWIAALPVHYAVELHDKLGVPVGVIVAAVGGSNIDSWNPANGKNANLYASQVAPLGPFALRGVVWYQGETNVYKLESGVYPRKLGELHTGWARQFARACLPFYIVQLAPFRYDKPEANAELPAFMEAQAAYAAKTPSAAITVINDIGNFEDIHPNNKWLVAKRLALHAYRREYGFRNVEDESPTPAAATLVSSNMVRIAFNHAKSLYVYRADSRSDLYAGFELAGADGVWKKAAIVNFPALGWMQHGVLTNNVVELVAKGVDRPVEVRHAYAAPFTGCLYNQVNLPCGPFRMRVLPASPLWIRPAAEASTNANVAVFRREVRVVEGLAQSVVCFRDLPPREFAAGEHTLEAK